MSLLLTFIGSAGAAIVLLAFLMNNAHKWKDTDFVYDVANFAGSLLLLVYAILLYSIPFMILNGLWMIVALRDVILYLMGPEHHHKRSPFSFFGRKKSGCSGKERIKIK